jgi:tRNA threonylcarbamoyladenosine biosynthesis protein TsaE
MHFSRTSSSEAETALIGRALGRTLAAGGGIILLDGPLGSGKTTLVRAVADGMDLSTSTVSSPTFVLVHEYRPPPGHAGPGLVHVDAYRLHDEADLESVGWDRVMALVDSGQAALIIEWSERLGAGFLRERNPVHIRIDHVPAAAGQQARELVFSLPQQWASRPGMHQLTARQPTRCPVTGELVPPDSPTYPFSSERARMADLYRWFSGSYQISRPIDQRDLEEGVD